MEQKYYICKHCGKIVAVVADSKAPVMCCGEKMVELTANTTEAAVEKHIPVFEIANGKVTVTVGSVEHPMQDEHYIQWVALQTKQGSQMKPLNPGDKPQVCFALCDDDEVEAVYAYCNLHGLWKAENAAAKSEESAKLSGGNYLVCKCNKVSYYDILDEIHKNSSIDGLLNVFEDVKDVTRCTTGCGGCYDKVMAIISEEINK